MTKPWSVAQLARAMIEQHHFIWDVAYCAAYYYVHGCITTTPWAIALSHIQRVKNIPIVTEGAADLILYNYRVMAPTECKRIFAQRRNDDNL